MNSRLTKMRAQLALLATTSIVVVLIEAAPRIRGGG
jgi:hypothetical protein